MEKFWRLLKRNKEKKFLILDIGTEAIKTLSFKKDSAGRIEILEKSLEYFDQYGVFNTRDFEKEFFKKAILRSLGDLKEKTDCSFIIGLPPNILKARIVCHFLKRKKDQKLISARGQEKIVNRVLEKTKEKIFKKWNEEMGLLDRDLEFFSLKILKYKIDGYEVPQLSGYKGKIIEVKVLVTFLIKDYFKKFEKIFEEIGLKEKKFFHLAEGLNSYFKKIPDALFLDVGGETIQFFLVKNNSLEVMGEIPSAGKFFSEVLSERLGIKLEEARFLKERYANEEFSPETANRIKEIFEMPLRFWFENLKKSLKKYISQNLLFQNIFIFGGAVQLPEIKKILREGNWESFFINNKPKIEIFLPEELKGLDDKNTSQYVGCFLLFIASQK